MKGEMKVAKKVKKLEEVKPVEEEIKEEPTELPTNQTGEEITKVEETTEAELPKVEFNEEIAPRGYSTVIPHVEDKGFKMKDGRVYQETGNGYGMFLDNGSVFKL